MTEAEWDDVLGTAHDNELSLMLRGQAAGVSTNETRRVLFRSTAIKHHHVSEPFLLLQGETRQA